MNSKIRVGIIICTLLFSSCSQALTYDYLMQHPDALKKQVEICQTKMSATQCDTVIRAAQDFENLVYDRGTDPIAFGEKIIRLQQKLVDLQAEVKKNNSPALQKTIQDNVRELNVLYAVVAATTLE